MGSSICKLKPQQKKCDMCHKNIDTANVIFHPFQYEAQEYYMCAYCKKQSVHDMIREYFS